MWFILLVACIAPGGAAPRSGPYTQVCNVTTYETYAVQEILQNLLGTLQHQYVPQCPALYPLQKILEAAVAEIRDVRSREKN